MPQTEHYQLNQWEFEDQILMADFNNDNQKIDAALHGLAGQIAKKADSAAVINLTAVVNNKAEQSALAAEETARQNADNTEKAAREAADTALAQTHTVDVATLRKENCWVKLGEWPVFSAASQIDLDLSGMDLSACRRLEVEFSLTCSSQSTLCMRVNHLESTSYVFGHSSNKKYNLVNISSRSSSFISGRISFDFIRGSAPLNGQVLYTGYDGSYLEGEPLPFAVTDVNTAQLSSIQLLTFSSANMIYAGGQVALYGLKK